MPLHTGRAAAHRHREQAVTPHDPRECRDCMAALTSELDFTDEIVTEWENTNAND